MTLDTGIQYISNELYVRRDSKGRSSIVLLKPQVSEVKIKRAIRLSNANLKKVKARKVKNG